MLAKLRGNKRNLRRCFAFIFTLVSGLLFILISTAQVMMVALTYELEHKKNKELDPETRDAMQLEDNAFIQLIVNHFLGKCIYRSCMFRISTLGVFYYTHCPCSFSPCSCSRLRSLKAWRLKGRKKSLSPKYSQLCRWKP